MIEHRVNTLQRLSTVPPNHGVEIDVRDYDGHLRLTHDPFVRGEEIEPFMKAYRHALLVFNTKCDGLEPSILDLVDRYQIKDYFFLDTALPTLVKLSRQGLRRAAVRYSEYEPIELAQRFAGLVDWVWVDCFTHLPLDSSTYAKLRGHFKICLVSPELQSHPRTVIKSYRSQIEMMQPDAVCTDHPEDWCDGVGSLRRQ